MSLVLPELILTATAVVLFLLDAFTATGRRAALSVSALGLLGAAAAAWGSPDGVAFGMLSVDPAARFLKVLLMLAMGTILALSDGFDPFRDTKFPWNTYAGLLLMSAVGLVMLVSSTDFLMVLISLELVSITSFILTGIVKGDRRSSEAAIKYFLFGALASGLMIYGISLVYGLTGTTAIAPLLQPEVALPRMPLAGALLFVIAGFGFKLALAPFHMWAPDVYEGAPTPVTAFLSIAPKAAAFGMLIRVLPNHGALHVTPILGVVAAITMTVGNLAALQQTNVKRLMAYSSIAHMGYILMGLVAGGTAGLRAVLIYLAAYVFMNAGAFACAISVANDSKSEAIEGFAGLSSRSFGLAIATTFFLLSLTGVPPFVGFIGKFSLFSAALQAQGLAWLAVVAAVNSAISFVYYFSIVRAMFFSESRRTEPLSLAPSMAGCLLLSLAVTVAAGLFPNTLFTIVQSVLP